LTNKPLTDAAVRKYAPGPQRRRIRDHGTPSLFLVIEPSGHRAFEMRFRTPTGRIGKIRLGPYTSERKLLKDEPELEDIGAPLTLADARLLALKVTRERKRGRDLIADHKARRHRLRAEIEDRDANTFAAAVRAYITEHARTRTRNWRATAQLLGLHYGDDDKPETIKNGLVERWGDRPVASIDEHDIWGVIDEARRVGVPGIAIRNDGISEARARALFVALSSWFGWLRRHRRVTANPCAGVPRPANANARERVLSADEIRWFWRATDVAGEPFAPLLKTLLLTGCRLREASGMTRSELSDDGATWSLPGSRTKNKKPHIVPLPPLMREIISAVQGTSDSLVFSTTGSTPVSGFSRMKRRLDKAMLAIARKEKPGVVIEAWRLHDLRRSCVTGMVELGIPPHVVEQIVNHLSGARASVAGTYNRSLMLPERKAALERWSLHVAGLVGDRTNVVVEMKKPNPRKAR
jgi:integrase